MEFSSTTTISYGSPATARTTDSSSNSPWTASSCCRSASKGRATTAIRRCDSARRRTSRLTSRRRRCSPRTATPTAAWLCSIPRPAITNATGAPTAKPPSDERTRPYDPSKPPPQQFGNPVHCIRIDKDGLVYVCDRTNNRLQVFRKDGTFVTEHVYEKATRGTGSV